MKPPIRKGWLMVVACMLATLEATSQDIIYKLNGDEIQAKVTEISPDEITYYRFDNLDGPRYVVPAKEIFMIKFHSGNTEIITQLTETHQAGNQVSATTASNGSALSSSIAPGEACDRGVTDAQTTYTPTGPMAGTYITSLLVMPVGLVTAIIVSNRPPSPETLQLAGEMNHDENYVTCYFEEARKIKKKKVWMSFLTGWTTGMAIAFLIFTL